MKPIFILLLLTISVFVTACSKQTESDSNSDSTEVDYKELDQAAEEDIKAPNAAEARAWLAVPSNAIFEGSKTEVIALTESFYKAGCPKVFITGIEKFGNTPVSASMVVVLPTDPTQRASAFAIENAFSQKEGETGDKDKGQKYMMLMFD